MREKEEMVSENETNQSSTAKKVLVAVAKTPFAFLSSLGRTKRTLSRDLQTLKDLHYEATHVSYNGSEAPSIVEQMVNKGLNPSLLAEEVKVQKNLAFYGTVFQVLMISVLAVTSKKLGIDFGILGYWLLAAYSALAVTFYLVLEHKAYRLFKMKDVTFSEFIEANDKVVFGSYDTDKKWLKKVFSEAGHADYLKSLSQ